MDKTDPDFQAMDAAKRAGVMSIMLNAQQLDLGVMSLVTVAAAVLVDVFAGALQGCVIAEKMGMVSRADTDTRIEGLGELLGELASINGDELAELLAIAKRRHDEAFTQAKEQELAARAQTVTASQFERMMRGMTTKTKGES